MTRNQIFSFILNITFHICRKLYEFKNAECVGRGLVELYPGKCGEHFLKCTFFTVKASKPSFFKSPVNVWGHWSFRKFSCSQSLDSTQFPVQQQVTHTATPPAPRGVNWAPWFHVDSHKSWNDTDVSGSPKESRPSATFTGGTKIWFDLIWLDQC